MNQRDRDAAWEAMKNCSDPIAKHWLCVALQNEGGAVSGVQRMLKHELTELELAINRPQPNTQMALSRVKNIRRYMETA